MNKRINLIVPIVVLLLLLSIGIALAKPAILHTQNDISVTISVPEVILQQSPLIVNVVIDSTFKRQITDILTIHVTGLDGQTTYQFYDREITLKPGTNAENFVFEIDNYEPGFYNVLVTFPVQKGEKVKENNLDEFDFHVSTSEPEPTPVPTPITPNYYLTGISVPSSVSSGSSVPITFTLGSNDINAVCLCQVTYNEITGENSGEYGKILATNGVNTVVGYELFNTGFEPRIYVFTVNIADYRCIDDNIYDGILVSSPVSVYPAGR